MFQNKHGKSSKQALNCNIWLTDLSIHSWTTHKKTLSLESNLSHKSRKKGLFAMYNWSATSDFHINSGMGEGEAQFSKIYKCLDHA